MAGRLRCGCFATLSVVIGLLPLDDVHMTTCNGRGGDDRVLTCWHTVASASTTTCCGLCLPVSEQQDDNEVVLAGVSETELVVEEGPTP